MPDYIVFGASGFTGKYACFRLAELQKENPKLSFGIAGRSAAKLDKLADILRKEYDCTNFDVYIADVKNPESLSNLCKECKVILNAVGPYRFWGEPVVKACADSGTHYVDICGEPEFIIGMISKYYQVAEASGAIIVHSCGFDSVPAEYGTYLCEEYFREKDTQCSQVTCFHEIIEPQSRGWFEAAANSATYVALIESFSNASVLKKRRAELEGKPFFTPYKELIRNGDRPKLHSGWFTSPMGKHSIKFMGADNAVVRAGQGLRDSLTQKQFGEASTLPYFCIYSSVANLWEKISVSLWGLVFMLCVRFKFLHPYMKKYPAFFSLGRFTNGNIRRELLEETMVNLTIYGKGADSSECVGNILLKDPGYSATANIMVACAQTILEEEGKIKQGNAQKKIPSVAGGVVTPGVAYPNTSLLKRLENVGISWKFRMTQ